MRVSDALKNKLQTIPIKQERIIKSYSKVTHDQAISHRRKFQKRNLILHPQDIKAKGFDQ